MSTKACMYYYRSNSKTKTKVLGLFLLQKKISFTTTQFHQAETSLFLKNDKKTRRWWTQRLTSRAFEGRHHSFLPTTTNLSSSNTAIVRYMHCVCPLKNNVGYLCVCKYVLYGTKSPEGKIVVVLLLVLHEMF